MKCRKIEFTCIVKKWFDRVNGNTYHSVRVIRHKDNAVVVGQFQYGYDEHYKQTALNIMFEAGWLKNYRQKTSPKKGFRFTHANLFMFLRENNYPVLWTVTTGLKRDCIENGKN